MIVAGLSYDALWLLRAFFAYGPQLILCLAFGYFAARRSAGDLLSWMGLACLFSLLPIVGVVAMWWLWRRARRERADGSSPRGVS